MEHETSRSWGAAAAILAGLFLANVTGLVTPQSGETTPAESALPLVAEVNAPGFKELDGVGPESGAPSLSEARHLAKSATRTFVENLGQVSDPAARFYGQDGERRILFESGKVRFQTRDGLDVVLSLLGASTVEPQAASPSRQVNNFLLGKDPESWNTNVRGYAEIRYPDVYPGIEWAFLWSATGPKYEFRLAAGTSPHSIVVLAEGAQQLEIRQGATVVLAGPSGELKDTMGAAWQTSPGGDVTCQFEPRSHLSYGFGCSGWDEGFGGVIDPSIEYGSFVGGDLGNDYVVGVATDPAGAIYLTGTTGSGDFPNTTGAFNRAFSGYNDIFVMKFTANGTTLVYSTFIGGYYDDRAYAIAVDAAGYAVTVGTTQSFDFPVTPGAFNTTFAGFSEGVIMKLNATGAGLEFSTFLGGNELYSADEVRGVDLDASGNAYVCGGTSSRDFPLPGTPYDAAIAEYEDGFAAKLNPFGNSLLYSTFLGGAGTAYVSACKVDGGGDLFVAGNAHGAFTTTAGAFDRNLSGYSDAFLLKVAPDGASLSYATFLGGSDFDAANSMEIAADGGGVIAGLTFSSDFPTTAGAVQRVYRGNGDAFVTKFSANGSALNFSTFLGGTSSDSVSAIAGNVAGDIYLVGGTYGFGFPTTPDAVNTTAENDTTFLTRLNATGRLLYSTYLGGRGYDRSWCIAVDRNGGLDIGGGTNSDDFPVTANAFDSTYGSPSYDGFLLRLTPPSLPRTLTATPGDRNVTISWLAPATEGSTALASYEVFFGTSAGGLVLEGNAGLNLTYKRANLTNGITYFFAVRATSSIGYGPRTSAIPAVPRTTPSAPLNFSAQGGVSVVSLNWTQPLSNGGAPISSYRVYRGTLSTNLSFLANVSGSVVFNDSTIIGGRVYYYRVSAVNPAGEGPPSNVVSATPTGPPEAPTGLMALALRDAVNLTWLPPPGDGGSAVLRYEILRGTDAGNLTTVTDAGLSTNFTERPLTNGVPYFFRVRAVNALGTGPGSALINVTPGAPPGPPVGASAIPGDRVVKLKWNAPADDGGLAVQGYRIYRAEGLSPMALLTQLGPESSFDDITVTNGRDYRYLIEPFNSKGSGEGSPELRARPAGVSSAPVSLAATADAAKVVLRWGSPEDDGGGPVLTYRIYRLKEPESQLVLVDETNASLWEDTTLARGARYQFAVSAVTVGGESALSGRLTTALSNTAPVVTWSNPPGSILYGRQYDISINATDAENDAVSVALSSHPAWVTLQSDGRLHLAPPSPTSGTFILTVVATDALGAASTWQLSFNVTNGVLTISPGGLPANVSGAPGATVRINLSGAAEDENDPWQDLSWSAAGDSSALSSWTYDNSTGILTLVLGTGGDSNLTLRVMDKGGLTARRTIPIHVQGTGDNGGTPPYGDGPRGPASFPWVEGVTVALIATMVAVLLLVYRRARG